MTTSAKLEVQGAIRNALKADATLTTLLGGTFRFFDRVPEREEMPYIYYRARAGEWDTSETDAASGDGKEIECNIHVWSKYEGLKECEQILQRITDLLQNNTSLALSGHNLVNMRFVYSDIVEDEDGKSIHGIVQFRAVTEET